MTRNFATCGGTALVLGIMTCGVMPARGGEASVTCTAPNNTFQKTVTVKITYPDGTVYPVPATIMPGVDAPTKAEKIRKAVDDHVNPNWRATRDDTTVTIKDLPAGTTVEFLMGETGEEDKTVTVAAAAGTIHFSGTFDPVGYDHLPAVFTAGIVTDVGELTAAVSAQELNFQTDGPIICQALFQRLAPRAPQYGAQINYAGDRLEVYFDPAYTVTQGGVIFGTSSLSPGCSGSVLVTQPLCLPCDTNCDGTVNPFDINSFLNLLEPAPVACSPCAGDANFDGTVNPFDINAFLECLSAP